jgi:hypothetical protein
MSFTELGQPRYWKFDLLVFWLHLITARARTLEKSLLAPLSSICVTEFGQTQVPAMGIGITVQFIDLRQNPPIPRRYTVAETRD